MKLQFNYGIYTSLYSLKSSHVVHTLLYFKPFIYLYIHICDCVHTHIILYAHIYVLDFWIGLKSVKVSLLVSRLYVQLESWLLSSYAIHYFSLMLSCQPSGYFGLLALWLGRNVGYFFLLEDGMLPSGNMKTNPYRRNFHINT